MHTKFLFVPLNRFQSPVLVSLNPYSKSSDKEADLETMSWLLDGDELQILVSKQPTILGLIDDGNRTMFDPEPESILFHRPDTSCTVQSFATGQDLPMAQDLSRIADHYPKSQAHIPVQAAHFDAFEFFVNAHPIFLYPLLDRIL